MLTKWHARSLVLCGVLVAAALVSCASQSGGNADEHWFSALVRSLSGPTPGETARQAFNSYDADRRREAINRLADAPFAAEPAYLQAYRLLLQDPDPTVRAAAVQALGRHGTVEDALPLAARLEDPSPYTRWSAAQALRRIHNPQAVRPLLSTLAKDADADVRIAAADALGQYPDRLVYESLVAALNDSDFSVARAARRSLKTLTGRDLGPEPAPWVQWSEHEPRQLFVDQQPYTYKPYEKPRSLWEKLQFWKSRSSTRETPVGLSQPTTAP